MKINAIVNQYPSGRWGFVGWKVPGELSYLGTPEELSRAHAAGCTQFLKRRVYDSKGEAENALSAWLDAHLEFENS